MDRIGRRSDRASLLDRGGRGVRRPSLAVGASCVAGQCQDGHAVRRDPGGIAAPITAGTVLSLPPVFDENFVQFVALISSGSFLAGAIAGFALWKLAYREPRRYSKGSVSEAPEP